MLTIVRDAPQFLRETLSDDDLRETMGDVVQTLGRSHSLDAGHEALDQIKELLGMPWAAWTADVSYPYNCPQAENYCRDTGWPPELLEIWRVRHAGMKMPFYIRCRFEHLPFITSVGGRCRHRASPERLRIDEIVHGMGITTMLTVPLHLPKGQVAMLTWAGSRRKEALESIVSKITGDLFAIGHHFMRIYSEGIGQSVASVEELSRLTVREWDCLRAIAQGYREAEVADLFGILKSTVRFHLDNVVRKFGCRNRAQAVAVAAQLGLLGPIGP